MPKIVFVAPTNHAGIMINLVSFMRNRIARTLLSITIAAVVPVSTTSRTQDHGHGTCIIIVRGSDFIAVGADSKVAQSAQDSSISYVYRKKIHRIGKWFYCVAGGTTYSGTGFDVFKTINPRLKRSTDPRGILPDLESQLARQLRRAALHALRNRHPDGPTIGKPYLQLAIGGWLGSETFLLADDFVLTVTPSKDTVISIVQVVRCPAPECGPLVRIILGESDHISQDTSWNPKTEPLEEWLRRLISVEAKHHPHSVGGNIEVMRLDRSGYK